MFAKLFDTELGQILVKLGEDEHVEIRVYFEPAELDLGVCESALLFKGEDDVAWDKAEAAFEKFDAEFATQFVQDATNQISDQLGGPR